MHKACSFLLLNHIIQSIELSQGNGMHWIEISILSYFSALLWPLGSGKGNGDVDRGSGSAALKKKNHRLYIQMLDLAKDVGPSMNLLLLFWIWGTAALKRDQNSCLILTQLWLFNSTHNRWLALVINDHPHAKPDEYDTVWWCFPNCMHWRGLPERTIRQFISAQLIGLWDNKGHKRTYLVLQEKTAYLWRIWKSLWNNSL